MTWGFRFSPWPLTNTGRSQFQMTPSSDLDTTCYDWIHFFFLQSVLIDFTVQVSKLLEEIGYKILEKAKLTQQGEKKQTGDVLGHGWEMLTAEGQAGTFSSDRNIPNHDLCDGAIGGDTCQRPLSCIRETEHFIACELPQGQQQLICTRSCPCAVISTTLPSCLTAFIPLSTAVRKDSPFSRVCFFIRYLSASGWTRECLFTG